MKNVLFVAPHADDEVLGCGATIAKFAAEGCNCYSLVMTNAYIGMPELFSEEFIAIVRNEDKEATRLLGVKEALFMEFPAPMLDQYPIFKMAGAVNKLIRELQIDTVFLPHRGDIHKDHKMVFDAGLVACRPTGDNPVRNVFCYETLSETEWGTPTAQDAFMPNTYVTFTKEEFQKKLDAFSCYKSQCRIFPESRSLEAIEALAKYRGATVTTDRAEAFISIRQII
ncbi:MAG: PIG-L family deacetylase [Bacteroides caccae]|jgi:LmbE family N-acetylglucosaminyl deacetylase|nr:PIG-L family deacetylase [Bacteroides caccae]